MDKEKYLCNNCGVYGHLFYNCKKPITSFGIICFRINLYNKIEYLMVQRKDSLGYVDFLRGKFNINNDKLHGVEHHLSHASSAFYPSPFKK